MHELRHRQLFQHLGIETLLFEGDVRDPLEVLLHELGRHQASLHRLDGDHHRLGRVTAQAHAVLDTDAGSEVDVVDGPFTLELLVAKHASNSPVLTHLLVVPEAEAQHLLEPSLQHEMHRADSGVHHPGGRLQRLAGDDRLVHFTRPDLRPPPTKMDSVHQLGKLLEHLHGRLCWRQTSDRTVRSQLDIRAATHRHGPDRVLHPHIGEHHLVGVLQHRRHQADVRLHNADDLIELASWLSIQRHCLLHHHWTDADSRPPFQLDRHLLVAGADRIATSRRLRLMQGSEDDLVFVVVFDNLDRLIQPERRRLLTLQHGPLQKLGAVLVGKLRDFQFPDDQAATCRIKRRPTRLRVHGAGVPPLDDRRP